MERQPAIPDAKHFAKSPELVEVEQHVQNAAGGDGNQQERQREVEDEFGLVAAPFGFATRVPHPGKEANDQQQAIRMQLQRA